jgi:hypothetical protein
MGSVRIDTSQWPIVVCTNEGAMGPDETSIFLKGLTDVLERRERYATVFDSSKLATFKMGDRDKIVQWLKDNDARLKQYSIGSGVVLSSAALRFVISGVLLVYTPASPIKVFPTLAAAMAWAKAAVATDAMRAQPARA